MKREINCFVVLLFFVVFLPNIYALTPYCGNNTMFTIYSANNSHAAAYTGGSIYSTQVPICYNSFFGGDYTNSANPWNCIGQQNQIIRLYSANNSHVSNTTYAAYPNLICFGDIKCEIKTSCNSGAGEISVASVSGQTNAHITNNTNYAGYGYRLCCSKTSVTEYVQWSNPISGAIVNFAPKGNLINLSATITGHSGEDATITVYNKSNGFVLLSLITRINGQKIELTKNITKDILMGNASEGATIYFNVSLGELKLRSNDLFIGLFKSAKWIILDANSNEREASIVNQTTELKMKVEIADNSLDEKNITFRIYDASENDLLKEINMTVHGGIAQTSFDKLGGFIDHPTDEESYYFTATDQLSGISVKSGNVKYDKDGSSFGWTNTCFDPDLTETTCEGATPRINLTRSTCEGTEVTRRCWYDAPNRTCREIQTVKNDTGSSVDVCKTSNAGVFSECVDGWKTLDVEVETLPGCIRGGCFGSGEYKVPCRAVALLPIFTFENIIVAAILIIAAYIVISRSKSHNKKIKRK